MKDEVDGVSLPKKIKTEPVDSKTEEEMKKQNKRMYKYVESLKNLKKPNLQLLLTHNKQSVPQGNSTVSLLYLCLVICSSFPFVF